MKVKILSMQEVNNMGSLLQAYGLKNIVEKLGKNVEFMSIQSSDEDNKLLEGLQLDYKYESGGGGKFNKIKKIDKYLFRRIKYKKLFTEQNKIFNEFRSRYISSSKSTGHDDIVIIGSDEVFNCLDSGSFGFTSQLFGNIKNVNKIITYAACCGATIYESVPEKALECIRDSFINISAFSVRDRNTEEFVSKLTNKPISLNLDPVLIYDFTNELANIELPKELPEKYCVIYSYHNRFHDKEEIKNIIDFCKLNGLKTVSIGSPQCWCEFFIPCTPFQCLKIFEKSSFVITDTFHGTIFSAKYARQYAVLIRKSNSNKLKDLVDRLHITDHVLDNCSKLNSAYNLNSNISSFNELLEIETSRTIMFLEENIDER